MISYSASGDTITFSVKAQPRASKSALAGEMEGAIKIKLAAPPVDGAANEELIAFLAERFGLGRRNVEIISGATGRQKIVRLHGVSEADFLAVIGT